MESRKTIQGRTSTKGAKRTETARSAKSARTVGSSKSTERTEGAMDKTAKDRRRGEAKDSAGRTESSKGAKRTKGKKSIKDEIRELLPECEEIADAKLRSATLRAWVLGIEKGGWKPSDIDFLPFTLLIPECDVSLLAHTRAVTKAAIKLGDVIREFFSESLTINRDVLVSGALVHDIGKLLEFEKKQGFFVKSPSGALLRHPFSGVFLAERAGLPPEVSHIVAVHAHEGDGGYRSPEAIIVNHCDFAVFDSLRAKARGK